MDSQPRLREPTVALPLIAATPLACPRLMRPQPIQAWTPTRLMAALAMALLAVPRAAPALIRGRRV